ncbi:hypothetical protein CONLIGDRAFT_635470 [Coniochaeta ligniaria NRRL 30616]|uniref:Uncharacterized protein n=1 Tax=Coniochaeta ligniaria NRRL 30616 TaxID=1408157 RepID=A0A1J7IDV4_9PEZI|nr:hypothetical protein CONLIGDRAFT_635470 [Coniochaeta ligniaria NRRL 30616]
MGEPSTDRSLFVRTIQWQQCNSDDASNRFVEYSLSVLIYSKNSKWLASLPRASIGYGNFISLESAVRVDGVAFSGEDLLADGHHFYLKFLKPWRMLLAYERGRGSVSVVGIDLPEMRNIVDETLVSRLRCPGDV